jgi:hypothetical protein
MLSHKIINASQLTMLIHKFSASVNVKYVSATKLGGIISTDGHSEMILTKLD